jgi:hypothetical protein
MFANQINSLHVYIVQIPHFIYIDLHKFADHTNNTRSPNLHNKD